MSERAWGSEIIGTDRRALRRCLASVARHNYEPANLMKRVEPLPGLTGIRGVAAMCVFLCHLQPIVLRLFGLDPQSGLHFIANGFRGVDLFFVLSGFILFHVHSDGFHTINGTEVRRFYTLRFFRVFPLNTVVLLMMVPLPFLWPQFVEWHRMSLVSQGAYHLRDFSFAAFVQSITLSQSWTFVKLGTWNEPAWTLSAEIAGYFFFPFIATRTHQLVSGAKVAALSVLSLATFVFLMLAFGHGTNNPSGFFALIRMGTCFVAGVGLCRAYQLMSVSRASVTALTVASTALIAICFWQDSLGALSVFGFGGLILGLAYKSGPVHYLVTRRPIMFLGKISFSFYILHLIPLELCDYFLLAKLHGSSFVAKCMALIGITATLLLLSSFAYRIVEVPCQRLGRMAALRFSRLGANPLLSGTPIDSVSVSR